MRRQCNLRRLAVQLAIRTSRPVTFPVKMPEVAVAAKVAGTLVRPGRLDHPIDDFCREHQDIVCRAREAWVSAFLSSQLDVCSFLWTLHFRRYAIKAAHTQETIGEWSYCRLDATNGTPSSRRCSIQPSGRRWVSFLKVKSGDWRPSRIASTMSGARKAHSRTRPTYRSSSRSFWAIDLRPETSPATIHSYHWRPRARAFNRVEAGSDGACPG